VDDKVESQNGFGKISMRRPLMRNLLSEISFAKHWRQTRSITPRHWRQWYSCRDCRAGRESPLKLQRLSNCLRKFRTASHFRLVH